MPSKSELKNMRALWADFQSIVEVIDMALCTHDAEEAQIGADEEAERLRGLRDQLRQQAEIHAQEARTANATIHEIYQLCTGATGEPGNWHGADPVRRLLQRAQRAEAENARLRHNIVGITNYYRLTSTDMAPLALETMVEALTRLAAPPPESEQRPVETPEELGDSFRQRSAPHTPEQTYGVIRYTPGPGEEVCHCNAEWNGPDPYCQMCEGSGICPSDEPDEPEQTGRRMIDTESIDERYAQFERRGEPDRHPTLEFGSVALERFIHDMMGEIKRLRALQSNRVPEQTGDALAALDDLDGALDCLYTKAMRDRDLNGRDAYAIAQAYDLIRHHLTASGVPYIPDEIWTLPGKWRQWAQEIGAVTPASCADALERRLRLAAAPYASGVPYVPENIRDLPDLLWSAAEAHSADITPHGNARESQDYANGYRFACRHFSQEIANRIAAAPGADSGEDE